MKGFFMPFLNMSIYQYSLTVYIIIINVFAYIIMCIDKYQSKRKGSRIAEKTLFAIAFLLGAPGIYAGMKVPLYHKSAKRSFKIVIPSLIILNLIVVYFFLQKI